MYFGKDADFILKTLEDKGYSAYAVGGCVRDILLGKTPHDIDITTSALPEDIKAAFPECKIIETGIKHGTVTVIYNSVHFEVTTFRTDGNYTDRRRPDNVSFGVSLYDDLSRRDFTVNAMCMDRQGTVTDFFGGKEDLKNGIIRSVGDARRRFSEDALRILRAIRFSAALGFTVEKKTDGAIRELKGNLKDISAERIRDEIIKTLLSPFGEKVMTEYAEVFSELFPEVTAEKIHKSFGKRCDIIQRICALFSESEVKKLRLSRTEEEKILTLGKVIPEDGNERTAGRLYYAFGEFARVIWEYNGFSENIFNELQRKGRLITPDTLAVKGGDITGLGFSGKAVGEMLKKAAHSVIDGDVPNDKEKITEKIKNMC